MPKVILSKGLRVTFVSTFLVCLIAASGTAGFFLGQSGRVGSGVPANIINQGTPAPGASKINFNLFWQAWNTVDQKYYGTPDPQKQLDGAISGMVAGLQDPYSFYLPPTQNQQFRDNLQGSFGGIGAELTQKDGLITVIAALQGTPAEKAGLKAQDILLEVDGIKTSTLTLDEVVNKIRGAKGSSVKLTLLHSGQTKPVTIDVTRDIIVVKSVSSSSIGPNNTLAYIKVNQYGDDTLTLFQAALNDAKATGKKGLVLDLRNNPGGLVNSAVGMLGMLLPSAPTSDNANLRNRVAVVERDKGGAENPQSATNPPILDQLPLVVLVNGGSASASEITAGALRDYKRATIVGTKSFGKGSVQALFDLDNHGSIKVTIAKWFTPLGIGIDGKGLDPDVKVDLPDGVVPSTSDVQVAKAIELLTK